MRYCWVSLRRKRATPPFRGMAAHSPNPTPVRTIMRISARNQIKGTVVEVKKGATTSHVRVDIGGGQIVTSSITNEAVDDLGIKAKGHVTVVVKASDVMIAVD
jgi:molybdopterin-binding protein